MREKNRIGENPSIESVVDPLLQYDQSTAGILLRRKVGRMICPFFRQCSGGPVHMVGAKASRWSSVSVCTVSISIMDETHLMVHIDCIYNG